MTVYCQHAPKLRLVEASGSEIVSERPRDKQTLAFLDGKAGTQVDVPEGIRTFDLGYALTTGALAELPCAVHPEAPSPPAAPPERSLRNAVAEKGA